MFIKSKRKIMNEKIADYMTKTTVCTILPDAVTKLSDSQTGMEVYAAQNGKVTILAYVKDDEITIKKCNW